MLKNYLNRLWQLLKNYFHKKDKKAIPHDFSDDETIIRAIFHPLFYTNRKGVTRNAFLPSPKSNDPVQRKRVSVYRKDYSSDNACKKAAVSIQMNNQSYIGFVAFISRQLNLINAMPDINVTAEMIYTPIGENNEYIETHNKVIFQEDSGVPMHAEINYSKEIEPDNPNTEHRKYADRLIEITKNSVYIDKNPSSLEWDQESIIYKE